MRLEIPFFYKQKEYDYFINFLKRGIDNKIIIPLVNNKLDKEYAEKCTDRVWDLMWPLCSYNKEKYIGSNNNFLFYSKFDNFINYLRIPNIIKKSYIENYKDILKYKSLVCLPYNNTSMFIFEQYNANMPMLFPSFDYLVYLWKNYMHLGVMSEISHWGVFNLDKKRTINIRMKNNIPNLNDYKDIKSFKFWSSLSEFYDNDIMPYIEFYDSIGELEYKLLTLKFEEISYKINKFNIKKRSEIINKWKNVFKRIK